MSNPKRVRISNVEFIKRWQSAKTVNEVADFFKGNVAKMRVKASFLRAKGVALKKFACQHGVKVDYAALANLAKSLAPVAKA